MKIILESVEEINEFFEHWENGVYRPSIEDTPKEVTKTSNKYFREI